MFRGRRRQSLRRGRSRTFEHKTKQSNRRITQTNSRQLSFNERFEKLLIDIRQPSSHILNYTIEELEPICIQLAIQQMASTQKPTPASEACPLLCLFCQYLIHEPLTLSCGHTFCEQCIKDEQISSKMNCPRCPENIQGQTQSTIVKARESQFHRNHFLKQFFERSELLSDKHQLNMLYHRGKLEYSNGKHLEAIEIYSNVLAQDHDHHLALHGRARCYLALNQLDNALSDATRVVTLKPRWPKGHLCRSEIFYQLNHLKLALLSSLKAMVMNPEDASAKPLMARHLHAVLHNDDSEQLAPSIDIEPDMYQTINCESTSSSNSNPEQTTIKLCKSDKSSDNAGSSLACLCEQLDSKSIHSRDFECSICVNLLWFPITTPCGHVFCRECLIRSIDNTLIQCPLCKTPIQAFFRLLLEFRVNKTELIERLMKTYLSCEYEERERLHAQENQVSIVPSLTDGSDAAGSTVSEVPVFVCVLALPFCSCPLHVFEPRYRLMMRRTLETPSKLFGMCTYDPDTDNFSDYGTLLHIRNLVYTPDGRSIVETIGQRRFRVLERGTRDEYHTAKIELIKDDQISQNDFDELFTLNRTTYQRVRTWYNALDAYHRTIIERQIGEYPPCDDLLHESTDGPKWAWIVLSILPINSLLQYTVLTSQSFRNRLQTINDVINFLNQQQQND